MESSRKEHVFQASCLHETRGVLTASQFGEMPLAALDFCVLAIAKMEDLHTGTSLGVAEMPKIPFPTPMVGQAVTPKSRNDEAKLSASLHKIVEEDSTFRLDRV